MSLNEPHKKTSSKTIEEVFLYSLLNIISLALPTPWHLQPHPSLYQLPR